MTKYKNIIDGIHIMFDLLDFGEHTYDKEAEYIFENIGLWNLHGSNYQRILIEK